MKFKKANIITLKNGAERQPIYYYLCSNCGKKRETIYKEKAEQQAGNRICGKCKAAGAINKDQLRMFESEVAQA